MLSRHVAEITLNAGAITADVIGVAWKTEVFPTLTHGGTWSTCAGSYTSRLHNLPSVEKKKQKTACGKIVSSYDVWLPHYTRQNNKILLYILSLHGILSADKQKKRSVFALCNSHLGIVNINKIGLSGVVCGWSLMHNLKTDHRAYLHLSKLYCKGRLKKQKQRL